ncbi:FAD-binding oxidoreductase [Phenylobacterium soli]|uniref:FAD-dependent oxidoreductase n=1 Tax=Phenylobacterium soli TaxID=2170551 RepID=A0A328AKQ3_9CAUL|nr:FAD-binding oxidoreductase [Phenylobacterium soli]RAK55482.1 FAD-dependent oxidoreductase [Phenylobacterium soli]
MTERVLVIGAGMAGLWTALALAPTGREVIVLDRDPPPPDGGPDEAFETWTRRGVGHLRHSHAFLARLRLLIRDQHPALLQELLDAGCRELRFEDGLTELHRKAFTPKAIDGDLVILTSRRTTLELVIRRYAERLANVTFRPQTFVSELMIAPAEAGAPARVTGVRLESGEEIAADVVVDGAGRTSTASEQLATAGVSIPESSESAGVIYFTRHYRLKPGMSEPPRGGPAANGDLGYLKFGVFPADNGCFSVTLCLPEVEEEMRKAVVDPAVFDAVCNALPGVAAWIAPERAEGVSRVFGMGALESRWRDLAPEGRPAVTGFFPVGDSLIRTNPLYGRGCSFAAVSAYLVRDALEATRDPAQRLLLYRAGVEKEIRPYYESMKKADRSAIKRARQALMPAHRPSVRSRILKSFVEDGITVAVRSDIDLMRASLRGFHMLEDPEAWLKRPGNFLRILGYWARGKKANAAAYRPNLEPDRSAMLSLVGVSPQADIERLKAA